jgi:eukaryotic-like serine/threonine-protein kinase
MASQEQTVEQLFGAALDRRPEDRCAYLDEVCAGEPELRKRVEDLLLANERAGSFLERSPLNSSGIQLDNTKLIPEATGDRGSPGAPYSSPSGRFQPGQVIAGRFAVVRFIDRGGMGEVYEVEDHFLQSVHVALKVILPHIAGDSGSSHRFEQEVLLARKVTHPNLCPIYDISRCEDPAPPFLFLTMKLLSGETLASRLRRSIPFSRNETISIFRQMIAGVTAIHAAGVVHRDIKPNNVMLDESGPDLHLSIMDFGLARLYASQTTVLTHGLVAGTPGYIAPELLRGSPPSQATDIFALGVLLQQVLTGNHPNTDGSILSPKASPELSAADVPLLFIQSVREFLSDDPARRRVAFNQISSTFESAGSNGAQTLTDGGRRILSRRNFVAGSAITACIAAGSVAWKWDNLYDSIENLLFPLPAKRFVALLNWPQTSDPNVKPMLAGVIDAIGNELARAEAFDRNLFVISSSVSPATKTTPQLNDLRDRLGANLVLAASGIARSKEFQLSLRLLDTSSTRALREKQISLPVSEQVSFPAKAVHAAAELLGVSRYQDGKGRTVPDTQSPEAFAAFQAGELLRKQPDDAGLEAAIKKYEQAITWDPRYASANARLAFCYDRLYALHGDPTALTVARINSDKALRLDPSSVTAHVARSYILEHTGDKDGAIREIEKALSIDPINTESLLRQGRLYSHLNRWSEAEDAYRRVIDLRPNYWGGHNEFGVLLNEEGKYSQALTEFRAASLVAPQNAMSSNNIAAIDLQLGRPAEAIERLKKILAQKTTALAAGTMAAALRSQGKASDALVFAQKSVALEPSDCTNWMELGDCYSVMRGRGADAKKAYAQAAKVEEEVVQTNPTDGPAWILLALARAESGSPEQSLSMIQKADSMFAGDMDSQLNKARTLEVLGKREDALTTLASCFKRGATDFQIQQMPDMGSLRSDPQYRDILNGPRSSNGLTT